MAKSTAIKLHPNVNDLRGQRFGQLTVIEFAGRDIRRRSRWTCLCDCGRTHEADGSTLIRGLCKKCTECHRKTVGQNSTTHGLTHSAEYAAWAAAKKRTTVEHNPAFKNYGSRGITMQESWFNSFQQFIDDMGLKKNPSHSLERKNNDLGYTKENCVWANQHDQARNKRNNRWLEHGGERLIISDWGARLNCNPSVISVRIRDGWSVADAVTIPVRRKKKAPPAEANGAGDYSI